MTITVVISAVPDDKDGACTSDNDDCSLIDDDDEDVGGKANDNGVDNDV